MAKKVVKKKVSAKKRPSENIVIYKYVSVGFAALLVVFAGKALISGVSTVHVLGASTGPVLLADHGSDDSGGSGSSDTSGSGSSGGGSGSSGSGSGSSGGSGSGSGGGGSAPQPPTQGSIDSQVSGGTTVDCVGPDGKHFTTSFSDCKNLNENWHRPNFSFTPLATTKGSDTSGSSGEEVKPTGTPERLEVETQHHGRLNLEQKGLKMEIEVENGQIKAKAKNDDGKEVELESKDALEQMNDSLENDGIEITGSSGSAVELHKHGVKALTEFPLSIDPTTHELTITTPSGVKQVTILPDQAVENVLKSKVLSDIETEGSTDSAEVTKTTSLTELNNEAVFEIHGVSQKRLLGLFPVGFAKTTFVSATNGDIVQTDESAFNKLLEAISF